MNSKLDSINFGFPASKKPKNFVQPIANGKFSVKFSENKDCTVRALANASDLSYEECHSIFEMYGRKRKFGCKIAIFDKVYQQCGFELVDVFGTTDAAKHYRFYKNIHDISKGITLGKVVDVLHEGSYIVLIRGHALAIVDGEVIDTFASRAGSKVVAIYKKL